MPVELASVNLYRLVRDFSLRTPDYAAAIRYQSKPDERFDLTLAAFRVYGNRADFLVIQAAAGLDSPEQELTERLLVLPPAETLAAMKRTAGFVVSSPNR